MWKPGQIVTINHKIYRVKSATRRCWRELGCNLCDFKFSYIECAHVCHPFHPKLDSFSYLKEIHPAKG